MSAGTAGDKLQIRTALFSKTDHGEGAFRSRNGFLQNHTALIQNQVEPDAPAGQFVGDASGTAAVSLLRTGGQEVNIPGRNKALTCQLLSGLQHGPQAALGIQRASSPELSVGNGSGEGRIGPASRCFHHIMMVHQHHRISGAASFPAEQKTSSKIFRDTAIK